MDASKIRLSAEERQLVQDTGWILTKQAVIDKVYYLFGQLAGQMQELLKSPHGLPGPVWQLSPKISRGEQYRRMPWVVLDYPRYFTREHVFAIRSFFWWGNYFSSTLQLKGCYQQQFAEAIARQAKEGHWQEYYCCTGGGEFDFDVHANGYARAANGLPDAAGLQAAPFVKLTMVHSLTAWEDVPEKLMVNFRRFISIAER